MYENVQREEKGKRYIIQSKKKVNEQCGKNVNKDVNGNRKLFWKEVSNAKGGIVESSSRVKDRNGRLAQGEEQARKIWNEYFEDLYNIDIQEKVAVHMGFGEVTISEENQLEELRLR